MTTKAVIEIEGRQNVEETAGRVDRSIGDLTRNLKEAFRRGVGESGQLMEDLAGKAGRVWGTITNPIALATAGVVAFSVAAAKGLKVSIELAAEFEAAMANVSTLVDTSVVNMDELAEGVRDIAVEVGASAKDMADGLYQVISAGVPAEKALDLLGVAAKAAKAGLTDTFTAVDGLTTVLNAYGLEAAEATRVSDLMFTTVRLGKTTFPELAGSIGMVAPMASAAGVSLEDLFAAVATLTQGGMETSRAIAYLRGALSNVVKPSSQAQELAAQLGIQFDATALQTMGLSGFLDMLREATGGNIEQMGVLFGSVEGLNAMLALTGKQAETFAQTQREMANSSGEAETAFGKQMGTLNAQWERTKSLFRDIGITIGEALLPAINWLLDKLNRLLSAVRDFFDWLRQNQEASLGLGAASTPGAGVKTTAAGGPQYQHGGVIPGVGAIPITAHGGEEVIEKPVVDFIRQVMARGVLQPAGVVAGAGTVNVYIGSPQIASSYDVERLGDDLVRALRLKGVLP